MVFVMTTMEFSRNGAELSLNSVISENLRNHRSMNWVQEGSSLLPVALSLSGRVSVSSTGDPGLQSSNFPY